MKKSYRKKSSRRRKRSTKVSKKVKSYVKKAIRTHIETKFANQNVLNSTITTAAGSSPTGNSLTPTITIGTNSDNRIGNVIRLRRSTIKGFVNLLPYNAVTNPMPFPVYIKMWVVSYKSRNTAVITDTTASTDFFNYGATNGGFQGNLLDMVTAVNTDAWTVHKTKMFKLGEGTGSNGYADNGSFTKPFSIRFDKYLKGPIKFNDATTVCTNKNLFLFIQAVPADGSATTATAEWHYSETHYFEDG